VERELARPAVLWVETPTNPLLRVANLARLAEVAGAGGAPMVVNNTLATGPSSSRSPGAPPASSTPGLPARADREKGRLS
jgi:Cys/Met metabolism PLP-dependent enzyme